MIKGQMRKKYYWVGRKVYEVFLANLPKGAEEYTALPWKKEVTIFVFLSYDPKTKFCLKYLIFNNMLYLFGVWVCCLKILNILTPFEFGQC